MWLSSGSSERMPETNQKHTLKKEKSIEKEAEHNNSLMIFWYFLHLLAFFVL